MARAALTHDEIESFREQICSVAARLFAEHGFAGVTLRAIAAELGCSPMTPYRYFADKNAIFTAVRAAAFDRFADALRAVEPGLEPEAQLEAMGHVYVQFALDEPHAYRIMFELDQAPDSGDEALRRSENGAWKQLHDMVVRCIDAGVIAGDPDRLAHCYWAALHGLVSLHLAGKLQLGLGLNELVTPMLHAVVAGTRPAPDATRAPSRGEKR